MSSMHLKLFLSYCETQRHARQYISILHDHKKVFGSLFGQNDFEAGKGRR